MTKINLSNNLIGRFYFKRTKNGNLIGEFSNLNSLKNSTESADAIEVEDNSFIGEYHSTWQENGKAHDAKLTIEYKENTHNSIYVLKWFAKGQDIKFQGEGFLVDDILIGDYRDFEIS